LMDVELIGVRDARALDGVINAEPPAEYLSPEQISRVPVTEKTDIYAFGVILYEMLCGVPPFRAATRAALLAEQQTETPVLLRRRRRAIPRGVEHIVMQALAKRPERRPLMPDLLDPLWAEAHGPTTRWRRSAAIVAGAGVAASIAVIVGWSLFATRASAPRSLEQQALPALTEQALPPVAPPAPPALAKPMPPPVAPPAPTPIAPPAPPALAKPVPPPQLGPRSSPRAVDRWEPPQVSPPAPPRAQATEPARVQIPEPARAPQARQTPAGATAPRPPVSSETQADDPGAVIDWLLKG